MGQLNLPEGARAAFRISLEDGFGLRFSIHVYDDGQSGWYVASLRFRHVYRDSGVSRLARGEWQTLLHHIERCGFWSLPEERVYQVEPGWELEYDGGWLTIAGRAGNRYHRIRRSLGREHGVEAVLSFACRVSGFFVRHPVSGYWMPRAEPQPLVLPDESTQVPPTPSPEPAPGSDGVV